MGKGNNGAQLVVIAIILLLKSCTVARQVTTVEDAGEPQFFDDGFAGFSLIDAATLKPLVQLNADKYFTPASNTKLFTMYAVLSTFADSIPGWKYKDTPDTLFISPQGDPTFLHPDFQNQKFFDYLKKCRKTIVLQLEENPRFGRFGAGWSWNGWLNTYAPERSQMPIYSNLVRVTKKDERFDIVPPLFSVPNQHNFRPQDTILLYRQEMKNEFSFQSGNNDRLIRPFTVSDDTTLFYLIRDTLKRAGSHQEILFRYEVAGQDFHDFYTAATDDVLRLMMHRSDNFIAEQLLLMVSKARLGVFHETEARSRILKDLAGVIENARWADASGLSRNNLFSPNEIVRLLSLMEQVYGSKRLSYLLPSGNEGTLRGLYVHYADRIYGKTGTLTDHVALSGYLTARSGRRLYFSLLINNHRRSIVQIRREIESFIIKQIEKY